MRDLIPFSYSWIFKKNLKRIKTILDVGSGKGEFVGTINYNKNFIIDGIELFPPYIKQAGETGFYKKIIKKDITKLNLKKKNYDAVICNQVIEHLTKRDGKILVKKMENYAKNIVLIGVPNGHWHQDEYDNNKLQKHRSDWSVDDFRSLGYIVRGQGLKLVYSEKGLIKKADKFLPIRIFLYIFSYLSSPLVYFFPSVASYLVAIKRIRN